MSDQQWKGRPMVASRVRVAARRSVVDAHIERRRQRREREERIAALAIEVNVALASGRAAMDKAESAAGQALNKMLDLGVSIAEVVEWCAGDLTPKEVGRLRRIGAGDATSEQPPSPTRESGTSACNGPDGRNASR